MPVKKNIEEIATAVENNQFGTGTGGIKEFHGECQVTNIEEYVGNTGKHSLKLTFDTGNGTFPGYLPATEKSTRATDNKVAWLADKAGIDYKKAATQIAEDEDVNTDIEFTLAYGVKIGKKLAKAETKPTVWVDRVKDGDFWSVQITFGKKKEEAKTDTDSFIDSL